MAAWEGERGACGCLRRLMMCSRRGAASGDVGLRLGTRTCELGAGSWELGAGNSHWPTPQTGICLAPA
ncbi:hypothetical protein M5D96_004657 [Drosophila gunungcola]|uniref:Uncharacterized protein n=1 Tax=Drosophila gunungcola TaxID=103775 RepID=A0A9P9YV36_9MUSC|nr:hypothetical protein M5D96_004657 [Drosophila gunungcola]